MIGIAPVPKHSTEVHERAFLHTSRDFQDERVVLALAAVECFENVLPGRPWDAVRKAEAAGRHAEVVD